MVRAFQLQQQSACERVIKRDIARTFPEHPRFQQEDGQGQQGLFNVIKVHNYSTFEYCINKYCIHQQPPFSYQ